MSAHIEFDFNDDGTVTMTHRKTKDGETQQTVFPASKDNQLAMIAIHGGTEMGVTHQILVGTNAAIRQLHGPFSLRVDKETGVTTFEGTWGIG